MMIQFLTEKMEREKDYMQLKKNLSQADENKVFAFDKSRLKINKIKSNIFTIVS